MITVCPDKISKLAVKKIVSPALFGFLALAAQMMGPVAYLYAQGDTISLQAKVSVKSIYCVSITMNGLSQKKVHIHDKSKVVQFNTLAAKPGDSGKILVSGPADHTCNANDPSLKTLSLTIPTAAPAGSTCTLTLDQAAVTAKAATLDCQ